MNAYVTSILAVDFVARTDLHNDTGWRRVSETTASGDGMTIQPVTAPSIALDKLTQDSPTLTYEFYAFSTGSVTIHTQSLPTHKLTSDHEGLRYAVSLNGDEPRVVDIHADEYSDAWSANTLRAAAIGVTDHHIDSPGLQTVRVWMVDAGVVLDKLTVKVE